MLAWQRAPNGVGNGVSHTWNGVNGVVMRRAMPGENPTPSELYGFGVYEKPADYVCTSSYCSGQTYAAMNAFVRLQREINAWNPPSHVAEDAKIGSLTVGAFNAIKGVALTMMAQPPELKGSGAVESPTPERLARYAVEVRNWLYAARTTRAAPSYPAAQQPSTAVPVPGALAPLPVRLPETVIQVPGAAPTRRPMWPWVLAGVGGVAIVGGLLFVALRR